MTCQVNWTDISYGAKAWEVAANVNSSAVWIKSHWSHPAGFFAIAKLNGNKWETDETQGEGIISGMAVDPAGWPAFRGWSAKINFKKRGTWKKFPGCGLALAMGRSFYKSDCKWRVKKYHKGGWQDLKIKAQSIATDQKDVWVVRRYEKDIFKYD